MLHTFIVDLVALCPLETVIALALLAMHNHRRRVRTAQVRGIQEKWAEHEYRQELKRGITQSKGVLPYDSPIIHTERDTN